MSWQDYVDNQLLASACVSRAAIAGHDGGIWAKSDGFEVRFQCRFFYKKKIVKFPFLFGPIFFHHLEKKIIAHIVCVCSCH